MRKYFMELFAMGFVDSEGNLVEENVLRDAQRTAALTAKIMKENIDNTCKNPCVLVTYTGPYPLAG